MITGYHPVTLCVNGDASLTGLSTARDLSTIRAADGKRSLNRFSERDETSDGIHNLRERVTKE